MAVAILLSGCSAPVLDTTSEETTKESTQRIRESLTEQEQKQFDEAIQIIAFSNLDLAEIMRLGANPDTAVPELLKKVEGKTGAEIIAEADRIKEERAQKQREQALKELAELEERRSNAEQARAALSRFEVQESRFGIRESRFSSDPYIRLKVHNGTEHAVSRAYFQGTLATPGRSVPWLQEPFNYQIRGGVEPGETVTWNLEPGYSGGWRSVEHRPDMVFTVEVVRLDGADGEPLYDATFSEEDQARLDALKEQYVDAE